MDITKDIENAVRKAIESLFPGGAGGPEAVSQANQATGGWLSSLGGSIGAGLDAAGVAFLKDLWDVILGPLEIIAGVVLAIIMLMWIFRDDLAAIAMTVVR